MRLSFLLLLCLALAFFLSTVPSGCATIVPPEGGPRDSTAPVLLEADPPDSSTNVSGRRFTFVFDELVEVKTGQTQVRISPSLDGSDILDARANGRTVTVRLNTGDSLRSNTTYIINFGDAVVDVHEGNALRNFRHVFSTGSYLDSLQIGGRVVLAETGTIDTNLVVALYRAGDDSAIYRQRPLYTTRLNSSGSFLFGNLPNAQFNVYVIGDGTGFNRTDSTRAFAFLDAPVAAGTTDSLLLYAYVGARGNNAAAPGLNLTQRNNLPAADRRLRFTPSTTTSQDLLTDFTLSFPVPLRSFDSSGIRLTTDSLLFSPVRFAATLDSTRKTVTLNTEWKENTRYNLELRQNFATDTNGRQLLKTDTLYFTTRASAEYGSLTLRFRNLDLSGNPVLLFVQNNEVVNSIPLRSNVISRPLFLPGEYSLRLLYDRNGDGRWTPGSLSLKRQPELVQPINRSISVKPSWDNEIEIQL